MRLSQKNYYNFSRTLALTLLLILGLAVSAAPALGQQRSRARAFLVDILWADEDGSGSPSCGEQINYILTLGAAAGTSLEDAVFELEVPQSAAIVPGSILPANPNDTPRIRSGNHPGDRRIRVELGRVCAEAACLQRGVSMSFRLKILDPNPATFLSVQGRLTGSNFPLTRTDDPAVSGPEDPTVTRWAPCPGPQPAAALTAWLRDLLVEDLDGDGLADPGDGLAYRLTVSSVGEQVARQVAFHALAPQQAQLVAGSVETSAGVVVTGNQAGDEAVRVEIGAVAPGETVRVSYEVRIADPLEPGSTRLAGQGRLTAGNLPALLTDNPDTATPADPTVTALDAEPVCPPPRSPRLAPLPGAAH